MKTHILVIACMVFAGCNSPIKSRLAEAAFVRHSMRLESAFVEWREGAITEKDAESRAVLSDSVLQSTLASIAATEWDAGYTWLADFRNYQIGDVGGLFPVGYKTIRKAKAEGYKFLDGKWKSENQIQADREAKLWERSILRDGLK